MLWQVAAPGQVRVVRFTGAGRLFERPMGVYQKIFESQRLQFTQTSQDITIKGALGGGEYELPGNVSSQFISGLLFALPLLDKPSKIKILPPFESRSTLQLHRDGKDYQLTVNRIDSEGTAIGAVLLAYDITQQLSLERSRRELG